MMMLSTFEQSTVFDPSNPNQHQETRYQNAGIPGGYASFYFNKVPTTTTLSGAGLHGPLDAVPAWGQALIVGGLATLAGYLAMKHLGPGIGKKIGVNLGGSRRRKRS